MKLSTVDRSIPEEVRPNYEKTVHDAFVAFYGERYPDSVSLFNRTLKIILGHQSKAERAFHKGHLYFNLGRALLGVGDNLEALLNMLKAYVEDLLNTPRDFEDDAYRLPAARFLTDTFAIQLPLLRELKNEAQRIKKSEQSWLQAYNPEQILVAALSKIGVKPPNILRLCKRPNLTVGPVPLGFPQPRDRRVFIGTNYDSHSHLIPEMRIAVISRNYAPVAARDVIIPPKANAHDVSLVLLHTCGWAVFDVTNPAGQVMEIERARDYGVNVLLVRSAPVSHPPHVSQMITSLGYHLSPYPNIPALRHAIQSFLP